MKKFYSISIFCISLLTFSAKSQTWITQNANTNFSPFYFFDISVVDNYTVYGVGLRNICRTIDGGNNWTSDTFPVTNSSVSCLQALSADTVWISTFYGPDSARLWKSTDGGHTWIPNIAVGFHCDYFHFFNSNEGVAFGDPVFGEWVVFTTTDGGVSWNPVIAPSPIGNEYCVDLHAGTLGDMIWLTSTLGRFFYSLDKGQTWDVSTIYNTTSTLHAFRVVFYSPQEGMALWSTQSGSLPPAVFRTHDGGINWDSVPHTGPIYQSFYGGLFLIPNSNVVIANGESGGPGSAYSVDTGTTWTTINNTTPYGSVSGKDWNSIWAGQYSSTPFMGGVAIWDGTILKINEYTTNESISFYPNPVSDNSATISFALIRKSSVVISVFDMSGKLSFQINQKCNAGKHSIPLEFKNVYPGIYLLKFDDGNKLVYQKIIIN